MALLLKFIAFPLYPVGLLTILGFVGLVLLFLNRRSGIYFILAAGLVLVTFSSVFVSRALSWGLEKDYLEKMDLPDGCSAIVVLGGGGTGFYPHKMFAEVNEAGDRIIHGARLYRLGVSPKVITTGRVVGGVKKGEKPEAEHNAMLLQELGVDTSSIIVEPLAQNTHEHAPYIAAIMDSLRLEKRIALVTSASHMRRATAVFKKNGFDVCPAPADFNFNRMHSTRITDILPSVHSLYRSTINLHEYYGLLGYKILGWI